MRSQIGYGALAIAAFGLLASAAPAKASTADDIAALKKRLQQLEAQVANQKASAKTTPARPYDPKGTGQGLIGTGTSGSAPGGVGVARGNYAGGSAPDPSASLQGWYNRLSLRGYTQMRYNDIMSGGPNYNDISTYNDRFVGRNQNFGIRRARIILSGDVSDHLYLYAQFDLASQPTGTFGNTPTFNAYTNAQQAAIFAYYNPGVVGNAALGFSNQVGNYTRATGNFAQIRDLYADIYIDKDKEFRVRPGYSKVPFGFTNLQSSQNRLTLDRPDALNTALPDERDLGIFFYYTPKEMRGLFRDLVKNNLKGSGDYGMVGVGIYNGQALNLAELNKDVHVVGRFTYPYVFENGQVVEASIQGYTGRYVPYTSAIRPTFGMATNQAGWQPGGNSAQATFYRNLGTMTPFVNGPGYNNLGNYNWPNPYTSATGWAPYLANGGQGIQDSRVAGSLIIYPQPFGLQGEWNYGVGPQLDGSQTAITARTLSGGYILANYKYEDQEYGLGTFFPFVQYESYMGGTKFVNSPVDRVNDWHAGLEWQPLPEVEITAEYQHMNRTNTGAAPYRQFQADLLRAQLQWNY
jgi:hypothetical protein